MNHAFDYVVTGDKLLISELEWNHGAVGKAVMTKLRATIWILLQ